MSCSSSEGQDGGTAFAAGTGSMPDSGTTNRAAVVRAGLAAAWPVCLGYLPIGLSLGVLAQKVGLLPWQIAVMSLLVFAGGSQFIAVAMIGAGASTPAIVSTSLWSTCAIC